MIFVGADLRWPAGTGIGVVKRELLARCPPGMQVVDIGVAGRIGSPLSPLRIASSLRRHPRVDVFWSPGYMPPAVSRVPVVLTVHDLTHLHYYSTIHRVYYSSVLRPLYRRCARIICGSEFARQEFVNWANPDPARVAVIPHGLAERFQRSQSTANRTEPYVLYPGNRRAYKNLPRLIQSYARSALPQNGIRLMLTGEEDAGTRGLARACGVEDRVVFAGKLDDDELAKIYSGALAVAFISLYEGFGLPIIEAMGCGVPVLCADTTSLPEVAGGAALLVDPLAVADIARGLERVTMDEVERQRLIAAGRQRAAFFDWNRSADMTWRVIAQAAVEGRVGGGLR